jgi:hypothetical protein
MGCADEVLRGRQVIKLEHRAEHCDGEAYRKCNNLLHDLKRRQLAVLIAQTDCKSERTIRSNLAKAHGSSAA